MDSFSRTSGKGFTQHFKMPHGFLRDRFCHISRFSEELGTQRKSAGFTLIEVMIALFVFLIITLAMAQTFTQSFSGYKYAKALQRDLENAQFALNLIAKELRTSTVISSSTTHVVFYDYSQSICFDYEFSANQLFVAKKVIMALTDPFTDCVGGFSGPVPIVKTQSPAGTVTGDFAVTPSTQSPQSVGQVTILLEISEGPGHMARIQTTASLRDYGYIGL